MRTIFSLAFWVLALAATGCRESKAPGPQPLFPEGGTTLFFANCDPFAPDAYQRSEVTLVPDARDVCPAEIVFTAGLSATWHSNQFRTTTGTLTEGFRLRLERNPQQAATAGIFSVQFEGLAAAFSREYTLPVGELVSVMESAERAESTLPPGTLRTIAVTISSTDAAFRLNISPGEGSFVSTEAERSMLCEFRVNLGLTGGIGAPLQAVNFGYENAGGEISTNLYHDFTGGASVEGTLFEFGPQYGVAYLTAESENCRDTAAFIAPAPAQGFRVDTLGNFATGDLLSDGQNVWLWEVRAAGQGGDACREVRIFHPNEVNLILRPVGHCSDPVTAYFDMSTSRFWIILRSSSGPDTAWAYRTNGEPDGIEAADDIPDGTLYDGRWLVQSYRDAYIRRFELTPFLGGAPTSLDDYPVEFTEQFNGRAGLAFPNTAGADDWTINIFDAAGHWVARYPIRVAGFPALQSISLLPSANRVVYAIRTATAFQVRVLVP